jgi:hypothetical protein
MVRLQIEKEVIDEMRKEYYDMANKSIQAGFDLEVSFYYLGNVGALNEIMKRGTVE